VILHCSHKLAAKLPGVSSTPLGEASPLGSWHGHLFTIDRRECVLCMHDATRYALFLPGLRKAQFAELSDWFRMLYLASLAAFGCSDTQLKKVELVLGRVRYDTATDRSVQGSLRVAKQDLEAMVHRVPNVMALDPLATSCQLSDRPATIHGKWVRPEKAMLGLIGALCDN
jgi:hypothetical protein